MFSSLPSENIKDEIYRAKMFGLPDIIESWLAPYGGFANKDVLEFGCGEGTMSLGIALRKGADRVVGVDVLDVFDQCLILAKRHIGAQALPENLQLHKIHAGEELTHLGKFDVICTWSVIEHVAQPMLPDVLHAIKSVLRPNGHVFLQISPLYYSAFGSHLAPWVKEPWAHLRMQQSVYQNALNAAPPTPADVKAAWGVYLPEGISQPREREVLWETFSTLNRLTAPQLCRLVEEAGFQIVREYRTRDTIHPPTELSEIYQEDVLTTEQIVLLLSHPATTASEVAVPQSSVCSA